MCSNAYHSSTDINIVCIETTLQFFGSLVPRLPHGHLSESIAAILFSTLLNSFQILCLSPVSFLFARN